MSRKWLFASRLQKSRQSELFRMWLMPDDVVLFRWGDVKQTGRILAVQRNSLLVDFRNGGFTQALRIPYDTVLQLVAPREMNQVRSATS